MSNQQKQKILDELRSLEYLWVGREIRKWFFGDVVGWNVCASSVVRKSFTIERLKKEIEEQKLPLEIKDEPNMSNSFQVYLKQVA